MPDVHVDHTGGGDDVPEDVFEDGPPGEDDTGGVRFTDRTQADKLARWRAYFDNGGSLQDALNAANHVAQAANAPQAPQAAYGRIVTVNYHGANGQEARLLSGEMFELGPCDNNGEVIDPHFDTNHPTEEAKKQAWCNFWLNGGDYAPLPKEAIMQANAGADGYINAIEPFDTDTTGVRAGCCTRALGWVENNPKKSAAIVLGVIIASLLGGLFGSGVISTKSSNAGAAKKPGKPRNLNASADNGLVSVTWDPPSDGGVVTSYQAQLIHGQTMETIETLDIALSPILKASFTTKVEPGSYLVKIAATNDGGSEFQTISVQVMEATPVKPGPGLAKPGVPTNAKAGYYETKVNVYWQPPVTGGAVESYRVELLDSAGKVVFGPLNVGTLRMATFEKVPAGTYNAKIIAINLSGTADVTVAVKPTEIDWNQVLTPAVIKKWQARMDAIVGMDQDLFWQQVFKAINDPLGTGQPGQQPASYKDQEVLASFLTKVVQQPKLPSAAQVAVVGSRYQWAEKIAGTAQPKFPLKPSATPYADPIAVWTAASKLQNPLDTAEQPLRYKLFGMERALERYLGIARGQQGNNP